MANAIFLFLMGGNGLGRHCKKWSTPWPRGGGNNDPKGWRCEAEAARDAVIQADAFDPRTYAALKG